MSRTRPEMRRGVKAFLEYVDPCFSSRLYDNIFAPNCAILAPGRDTGTDLWIPFRGRLRSGHQMGVLRVYMVYAFGVHPVCHIVSTRRAFCACFVCMPCRLYATYRAHLVCRLCVPVYSSVGFVCMPYTLIAHDVTPPAHRFREFRSVCTAFRPASTWCDGFQCKTVMILSLIASRARRVVSS